MKQRFIIGLLIVIMLLSSCSAWENAYEQAGSSSFKVASIKDPSALSFIKAMKPEIKPMVRLGDTVQYTFEDDEDVLYTRLLEGEFDIADVPMEMAAKLYNNGAGYQLAAVNTGGYLYLLTNDKTTTNFSDLIGKTVKVVGEHSASDVVLRYLLLQNGINLSKDVTLEYAENKEELIKDAAEDDANYLVLPEPWASNLLSKNIGYNIAINIQDEWARVHGTVTLLPQTCLIVKKEIASQKAEAWKLFLEDYMDSIKWINSNQAKTVESLDNCEVGIPTELAQEVIPRSNLEYFDVSSTRLAVDKYLNTFFELSPESIGGKLPNADFYAE
jgi:NitT/TauT family transport system substrate-binding protein